MTHKGHTYEVVDTNGMINDRGQRLFEMFVDGESEGTIRAATKTLAEMYTRVEINEAIDKGIIAAN